MKPMTTKQIEGSISWLESLLRDFQEATKTGKETNSNEVRAESISEIEEITRKLEAYIRNNEDLLELITGKEIEIAAEIAWDDVVRPAHFEEDLQGMIYKLKEEI